MTLFRLKSLSQKFYLISKYSNFFQNKANFPTTEFLDLFHKLNYNRGKRIRLLVDVFFSFSFSSFGLFFLLEVIRLRDVL